MESSLLLLLLLETMEISCCLCHSQLFQRVNEKTTRQLAFTRFKQIKTLLGLALLSSLSKNHKKIIFAYFRLPWNAKIWGGFTHSKWWSCSRSEPKMSAGQEDSRGGWWGLTDWKGTTDCVGCFTLRRHNVGLLSFRYLFEGFAVCQMRIVCIASRTRGFNAHNTQRHARTITGRAKNKTKIKLGSDQN